MALTTHIETNEVSIKDILSPSYDVSAFRPKHSKPASTLLLVYALQCIWVKQGIHLC